MARRFSAVLILMLGLAGATPVWADSPSEAYMSIQEVLSGASSEADLDKARQYFTGDAGKAFDKVREMAQKGTLHDDPVQYVRMIFQTADYPPKIISQKDDGSAASVSISGIAPFATYGTKPGAPVKATVSLTNEEGQWKISDLKSVAGGLHAWAWYGIELDK